VPAHAAAITPTPQARNLRTGSFDNARLNSHQSQRITGGPSCITNPWVDSRARHTVAQRDVAGVIHGNATHPPIGRIRCVGTLLIDERGAGGHCTTARVSKLIPSHACDIAPGVDGVIYDQSFVTIRKGAVCEPVHQAVTE